MSMRHLSYLLIPISVCYILVDAGPAFTNTADHLGTARGPAPATITPKPLRRLSKRQDDSWISTCGYVTGDPDQAVIAPSGSECTTNTDYNLWGFCATTVSDLQSCSLAVACEDYAGCYGACNLSDDDSAGIITTTCSDESAAYCAFAIVVYGSDTQYASIGCGTAGDESFITTLFAESSSSVVTISISYVSTKTVPMPSTSSSSSSSSQAAPSSPAAQSHTSSPTPTPSPSTNTGTIVGGVIGSLAILCLVGLALYFLRRFRVRLQLGLRSHDPQTNEPSQGDSSLPPPVRYSQITPGPRGDDHDPAEMESPPPPVWLDPGKHKSGSELKLPEMRFSSYSPLGSPIQNTDRLAELDSPPEKNRAVGDMTGNKEPYRDEPSEIGGTGTEISSPTLISEPTERSGPSERAGVSDLGSEPTVESPR